ncbi:MAG: ferrous iron transport protein B [Gammaproteobacteria bacterium]
MARPPLAAPPAIAADGHRGPVVALIGNPNTGKSTLFNALTGLKQKTANYPGVTVERHTGVLDLGGRDTILVDLPGAYSLAAQSPDEMIAIDVLLGHVESLEKPKAILAVADATNLRRNLFLVTQLAELDIPIVLAVNMMDLAEKKGISIDLAKLGEELGITAIPIIASRGRGLDEIERCLTAALTEEPPPRPMLMPAVHESAVELHTRLRESGLHITAYEVERALIDAHGSAERRFEYTAGEDFFRELQEIRSRLGAGSSLAAMEAKARYELIGRVLHEVEVRQSPEVTLADRLDRITKRPAVGTLLFLIVMATVFQAVFSWATPMMDLIEAGSFMLGDLITHSLPPGAVSSLLVDGVIAGVGSVVVFLPQILILFTFIIFLEDSGYMPRVAFMADRLMRSVGLSGQSFIPMLSAYACAVPAVMATRVIPDRRDRLATMLAAPLMTCSARLPVYALLIAAFVPDRHYMGGLLNLQGLVLLGLYVLGIAGGVCTALLLKRTALRGPTPTFLIELPPYRMPHLRSILIKLWSRAKIFLTRAGTIIFTVAVIVWALAYFPRPQAVLDEYAAQRTSAEAGLSGSARAARLNEIERRETSQLLEHSALGRIGKFIEPAFEPLGWDWKVSAAVVAGFPAREVVIAVLGTIYAVGDTENSESALVSRLKGARRSDGSAVFTVPMVMGMLFFYAFCLQCAATVAVIYRETDGWRWPLFAWTYMTGIGYLGAMLIYGLGS